MDTATPEAVRYLMGLQELVRAPDRLKPDTVIAPAGGSAPTIVVAASNTSILTQMKADYVSGTPDATPILQIALEELKRRGGGRLLLTEGLFGVSSVLTTDFDLTIEGMNREATTVRTVDGVAGHDMFQILAGNFTMLRINLDGNKQFATGTLGRGIASGSATQGMVTLTDMLIHDFQVHGVELNRTAGVTMMHNVYAYGNGHYGIWIEGEGTHFLTACLAQSNGSIAGLGSSTADGFNITGTGVKMIGCEALQNTGRGLVQGGGLSGGTLLLVGNRFIANGGSGMDVQTTFGGLHVIANNIAYDNGGHGLEIGDAAGGISVTGNVAANNDLDGILIGSSGEGGACTGNTAVNNGRNGIRLTGQNISVNGAYRWLVSGNMVASNSKATNNTYDGIVVEDAQSDYCSVLVNKVWDTPGGNGQRYGINMFQGTNHAMIGNDARASGRTADYNNPAGAIIVWAGAFGDNL